MKTGVISRGKLRNIKCVISSLVREPEKLVCSLTLCEMFPGAPNQGAEGAQQGETTGKGASMGLQGPEVQEEGIDYNTGVDFYMGAFCPQTGPQWGFVWQVTAKKRLSSCQAHSALLPQAAAHCAPGREKGLFPRVRGS